MTFKFQSIASGSSGNCYYLGTDDYGILFDAGVSLRSIKKALKDNGIEMDRIMAVFITHDHTDHVKYVGSLGEKLGIPIYATELVHKGINSSPQIEHKLTVSRRTLVKEEPIIIRDFKVTAFDVPHDASDCVGYQVIFGEHHWVLATDVGRITEKVADFVRTANHLVIETNYDPEMLSKGKYPDFLKERISGEKGHLSNTETAEFLASNFDLHLKNIWLCHLSKDNNHPELAVKTVEMAMGQYGIRIGADVNVYPLKRTTPSEMFYLK
ncbi:MAG: MBL fold metallo-hydrolase [Dysgonamonadaceae bacterium]|jgi:phosphoribosyl 1,2-cyclic phosphodiesterase|nr:MBL fold metallo-hydrolase [Dysgonamonadaceae bacterium]